MRRSFEQSATYKEFRLHSAKIQGMPANPPRKPDLTFLKQRAVLLRDLRQFFDSHGFFEVQPPCLARDCVVDPYIDPIEIDSQQFGLAVQILPSKFFMQTSPELSMKRMLSAGAPSIYSIGPVFRAGELGAHHNVEFTMLEWYDVGARLQQGTELLGKLAMEILSTTQFDVVTYRDVFSDILGFDPIDADDSVLLKHVEAIDAHVATSLVGDRDSLLDVLMSQRIQPQLGFQNPLIVTDYPISQAALAKPSERDPECAMRFELFAHGIELANGYDELLDADELVQRTHRANEIRASTNRPAIHLPETLIQCMRDGLPQCTGVALGVDRLLMLRARAKQIDQVIPFTSQNA